MIDLGREVFLIDPPAGGCENYGERAWEGGASRGVPFSAQLIFIFILLTFVETQGTHMVSINQPPPPFQADRL